MKLEARTSVKYWKLVGWPIGLTVFAFSTATLEAGPIEPYTQQENAPLAAVKKSVRVSIVVGTDGRAKKCTVIESSGNEEHDKATCPLVTKRGRWKPVLDEAGKPVEQTVVLRFRWEVSE
ncbi:energy transducer TonB [Sphingomonas sp.]|uniref:energy transducer TonB n=1 Tax=Sphingomonas sp. TaxID=28214 RepID=UPI003F6F25EA